MRDLAYGLVRVLDDDGKAVGAWDPELDAETLRRALRAMMLTRAFDERMFRMQRQGKTSFYLKCTGEEAVAVGAGIRARARRHVFPDLSPAGPSDRPRLAAARHDVPDLHERAGPAEGPAAAGPLLGARGRLLLARRQSRHAVPAGGRLGDGFGLQGRPADRRRLDRRRRPAEGDFHHALTFAAVYHAPVILNVVNNQWAISSSQGVAGGEEATFASRAIGFGIPGIRVDGNDLLAVYAVTRWAADRARSNHGPTLIELFTYRVAPHSTSDDPSRYRPGDEGEQLAARRSDRAAEGTSHPHRANGATSATQRSQAELEELVRATEREARGTACSARARITSAQHDVRGRLQGDAVASPRAAGRACRLTRRRREA